MILISLALCLLIEQSLWFEDLSFSWPPITPPLQAVSSHVPLDLLVEEVQSGQSLDKLQQLFTKV
jgi:hypothetical protein